MVRYLWLRSSLALVLTCSLARAEGVEERLDRLERVVAQLVELVSRQVEGAESQAVSLQLEAIRAELAQLKTSPEPESETPAAQPTPSPLQPRVQATVLDPGMAGDPESPTQVPYSGYMEFHVNKDNLGPTTFDFHRFVLLFGHGFGSRIRFWSELELEHAFIEGGEASGELELEQAYLDFLIHPKLNFRTGMLLTPVGIINERHEPPAFHGVERPFVDTVILPTTWFGTGAGLVGDLGKGFSYRAYAMSSLNALEFSAEEGVRDGRQKGFLENARNPAFTGRLEYRGVPGLNLGTSFWTGETGFNFRDLNARLNIFEFDGRYRLGRLESRGQFVLTDLADAAEVNRSIRRLRGINPNVAERMRGFYLEGALDLLPQRLPHRLAGFYRYENFDTQFRMPAGFLPLKQFDRSAHILGLTYFPYPDVALKFDYNFLRNKSSVVTLPNRWNWGVGWWF